jgi:hypothetical protein
VRLKEKRKKEKETRKKEKKKKETTGVCAISSCYQVGLSVTKKMMMMLCWHTRLRSGC